MVIISFSLEQKGWVILARGGLETYEQKKRTSLMCFPSISKTDLGKIKRWGLFP